MLVLKDGTIIKDGRATIADGNLMIWLPGISVPAAAPIVTDKHKTARIIYREGKEETVFTGYTTCTMLMVGFSGETLASLEKG